MVKIVDVTVIIGKELPTLSKSFVDVFAWTMPGTDSKQYAILRNGVESLNSNHWFQILFVYLSHED